MKKNYLIKKLCLAILFVISFNAGAQISGIVTVDNGQITAGTNYQSFAALVNTLNAVGVNGPLTVNVIGSPTFVGVLNFTQTPGISATSTITINGNGCTLTNAGAAATPWTVLLTGADYITFNNMNIIGTGGTNALTVHLWNDANNNRFNNCVITSPSAGTGTGLCPFSVSGSSVTVASAGNGGSNNIVSSCTLTGGYYSAAFYGQTTAPFPNGNQVINSLVREFYIYGIYNYYNVNSNFSGNIVERPTRTAITSGYGVYLTTGSSNCLVERNHIRRMHDAVPATAAYAVYVSGDGALGNENKVRNNIISDIKGNGTIYGLYLIGGAYCWAEHNTIVLNDATSTAGTTYGIYSSGPNCKIRNNISFITRAGTGTKYCLYLTTAATPLDCNFNNLVMNSPAGANGLGYLGAAFATLPLWQAGTGFDMNSTTADPLFNNPALMDYAPTEIAVNNTGVPVGIMTDFYIASRSPVFPDPGAIEFFNTPCVGLPPQASVLTFTQTFCPNTPMDISLTSVSQFTNSGYSIQWQYSSPFSVGPYLAVPGATVPNIVISPSVTTYYNVQIGCANGGTITTPFSQINVATTVTNTVPYFESFESLAANELPNCSWSASNMGGSTNTFTQTLSGNRIPHSGTNYAAFFDTPTGTSYFYTNGIELHPGVTYSASLWYITGTGSSVDWPDLSIMYGLNQTPAGLTTIASTGGTVNPVLFTSLSNTFTVPQTGLYYVAIKATSAAGVSNYLSWDDLSIIIPCSLNGPALTIGTSANVICSGRYTNINVIGAPAISWSSGESTASITVSPSVTTTYIATGTGTIAGCTNTIATTITVNPTPPVFAFASDADVCAGTTVTLTAAGAATYFWAHGTSAVSTVVTPTANTTYTVVGTTAGCYTTALVTVTANPVPGVQVTSSSTILCAGEPLTLQASGPAGLTYQWLTDVNTILLGNPLVITPAASGSYTLSGTTAKGCEGRATFNFELNECTGINTVSGLTGLKVYPNPGSGLLNIESDNSSIKAFELTDVTGRVIMKSELQNGKTTVDISNFANGVYYMKLQGSADVIKVIKNN